MGRTERSAGREARAGAGKRVACDRALGGSHRRCDGLRFGARPAHGPRLPAILARHVVAFGALGLCRLANASPAEHRIGDTRREQPDRAQRVVVPGMG